MLRIIKINIIFKRIDRKKSIKKAIARRPIKQLEELTSLICLANFSSCRVQIKHRLQVEQAMYRRIEQIVWKSDDPDRSSIVHASTLLVPSIVIQRFCSFIGKTIVFSPRVHHWNDTCRMDRKQFDFRGNSYLRTEVDSPAIAWTNIATLSSIFGKLESGEVETSEPGKRENGRGLRRTAEDIAGCRTHAKR